MKMRKKWIFIAPAAIAGIVLVIAIGGTVVQQLWNWLLPSLFGFRTITFWQALGLLALCRILFGGTRFHGTSRSKARRRIAERLDELTPEERERLRERMLGRCGFGPAPGESRGQ